METRYMCSQDERHLDGCSGDCGEYTDLHQALDNEMTEWKKLQFDPFTIDHNVFNIDVQVMTLISVLKESGVIDEDALNIRYREIMIEKLQTLRKRIEPELRRARIQGNGQPLLGPDGKPFEL